MKARSFLFSSAVAILFSCGGGGDSAEGLSDCNQAGYDIYLGYYLEDPYTNPEDPTSGFLIACIPSSNGTFKSQFLFSYYGCAGGIDVGNVEGNRIGNSISGSWRGSVDGISIGGSFMGNWDGVKFSGTWDNSGRKVRIDIGDCSYFVAPNGEWVLYALDSDEGGVNIQVTGSLPSVSWNNSIAGVNGFLISVYDKICMYNKISLSECTVWSLACLSSVSSLDYGSVPTDCYEYYPDQPLTSGKDYVISITAYGSSQSDVIAFASKVFTAP